MILPKMTRLHTLVGSTYGENKFPVVATSVVSRHKGEPTSWSVAAARTAAYPAAGQSTSTTAPVATLHSSHMHVRRGWHRYHS